MELGFVSELGHGNKALLKNENTTHFSRIIKNLRQQLRGESFSISLSEENEYINETDIIKLIKLTNKKLNELDQKVMRNYLTIVELSIVFVKLSEIENIKQKFESELYLEAKWMDNSIIDDTFDINRHWTPDIYIENVCLTGQIKQTVKYKLVRIENDTFVIEMRTIKGNFYEKLEVS
jgi:hypothetical protein